MIKLTSYLRLHTPPAFAWAIIVLCTATIVYVVSFVVPLQLAGQAYVTIIILLAFRYWPPMTRCVKRMPIPHRVVFGVLIGGMILGHYTLNGRRYFPFVSWQIFPAEHEDNPVTCREFVATTMAGHKVRLLVEQLFPSIVQINPVATYTPEGTEHLARALAKMYNQLHAADPVFRVDLMDLAVQLHPPPSESRAHPSCELLQRYDISSGQ